MLWGWRKCLEVVQCSLDFFFFIWNESWAVQSWMRTIVAFKGMQLGGWLLLAVCARSVLPECCQIQIWSDWGAGPTLLCCINSDLVLWCTNHDSGTSPAIIKDRKEKSLLWKGHCKNWIIKQNVQILLGWVEKPLFLCCCSKVLIKGRFWL